MGRGTPRRGTPRRRPPRRPRQPKRQQPSFSGTLDIMAGWRPAGPQDGFAGDIDPVSDPLYSLREACIQAALLERHLTVPNQQCEDCIRKHFYSMEGFLTEALQLGVDGQLRDWITRAIPHLRKARAMMKSGGMTSDESAHAVRDIRKFLSQFCDDVV